MRERTPSKSLMIKQGKQRADVLPSQATSLSGGGITHIFFEVRQQGLGADIIAAWIEHKRCAEHSGASYRSYQHERQRCGKLSI